MRAALAGDEIAYRQLLEALAAHLRAFVRYRIGSTAGGGVEVEDIVQETLLAIHLKRHTWRPSDPLGPWVGAIARNKFIDVLRRRGRRGEVPLDDLPEIENPAESMDADATSDVLRLMSGLAERQRRIVNLMAIEGHTARSAAAQLGMTEGAVRVALHRSLRQLAGTLRGEES
jgi:RNA polymerase sigma-70 factor (ECF subfamily)